MKFSLTRFFTGQPTPEQRPLTNTPALVTCGIYKHGKNLLLVNSASYVRGMKIVTISPELYQRFELALYEWIEVQDELAALPKSLRPRRRSTRKAKVEPEGVAVES
jgi:hypothetical protein